MSAVPSPAPETRQVATTRVRRMRAARGACWVIVVGLLAASGVALLDAAIPLPGWVRGLALAGWITGVGVLAWRLVVRAWRDEPMREPTREARRELPGNLRAAAAATCALVACLLAGAFVPGATDHLRRVVVPWHRGASSPYRIVVTSGEPVVRRTSSVTLTAYVEKTEASALGVTAATLIVRETAGGEEQRFPMTGDGNAAFHATRPVPTTFSYCIEAGGASSDWLTVTALDPVELAEGSVTELQPPKYAPTAAKSVQPKFAPLEGVQNATAEFRFRFTRPAADAYIEFRTDGLPEITRFTLSADRLNGTATLRLKQDGTLRLVLVAEENGRRLISGDLTATVKVKPDTPPRFEQISGVSPRPMTALPGDKLHIAITATDDIAVGSAVLEWVAPGESRYSALPIPLSGAGTARARGELVFDLADKAKPGEALRFRIKVSDTRRLDDSGPKPQEALYPPSDWLAIKIDVSSSPLEVQEIGGRRDVVQDAVNAAVKELREAAEEVGKVAEDIEGKSALAPDHIARLGNSRENIVRATSRLHDAAREAALNPELHSVAVALRGVIDGYLKNADEAIRRAGTASVGDRAIALATAAKHLGDAGDRTEELAARNVRIARDRLDTRALAGFAAEQAAIVAKLANTSPAEVAKHQQELLAAFTKLLQESAPLREATDAAKQQEFDRLAGNASDLAGMIRDLSDAVQQFHAETRGRLFTAITSEQKELATRAAAFLPQIETACRLANAAPPKAEEFRKVAELVNEGKNLEALTEMARLATALEAIATTFEKWATDRIDSKIAARHLALWQDDLRTRFRAATAGNPVNYATLPAATRTAFRSEQASIRAAAAALRVPPGEAATARDTTLEHLTGASNFLNGTGANADNAMKIAVDQLNRLAEKLPTIPERLAKTRPEFDKVVREQELILTGVEQVYRNSDIAAIPKKLLPFADRQQRQHTAFSSLDLPGFDARRVRTLAALAAATADLQNAVVQDVLASQAWAKRELDRMRSILFDNAVPPDDKVYELARRMETAAKAIETSGANPTIAANVQDIFRQLNQVTRTPEAAALLYDAVESSRVADLAFRTSTPPAQLTARLRRAADDLATLSDRLNGAESEHDRIRRLAANRRAAAIRAREVAPNSPVNPETVRELAREMDELANTRVGFAGQALKKRLQDEYARLRDKPGPDRQAGIHANLATWLDELAAVMADIPELTATFERAAPAGEASDADSFLPSRTFANALRDLANLHRTARTRITNLPEELAKWIKPAKTNPLAQIEQKQRELTNEVANLVESLAAFPVRFPADPHQAEDETRIAGEQLRNGSVGLARQAGERASALLRKLSESPHAKTAAGLADRQDAILKELAAVADLPGVVAARQRARVDELARVAGDLVKTLESAARDTGTDSPAGKTLTEAANTAAAARKLLTEADQKWLAGKVEEAGKLRVEAEVQFRVVAAKTAGAGPAPTTLPTLSPDTAAIGEALRRTELAMRHAVGEFAGKPDLASAKKAMQTAADGLGKAAKAVGERLTTPEGK